MQFELWGATAAPWTALDIHLPTRPLGYLILALYVLGFASLIYQQRHNPIRLTQRRWLATGLLALLALLFSQLFLVVLTLPNQLADYGEVRNPGMVLAILGYTPIVLAAATLNPVGAMIVGFAGGLGRSLWQTQQLFDPFHLALAGYLASGWMQQNYRGRLYAALRRPFVSGPLSILITVPLAGLAAYTYASAAGSNLFALDLALSTAQTHLLPVIFQGLLAGVIVAVILRGLPHWSPRPKTLVSSPTRRSLRRHLLSRFALFAAPLLVVLISVIFSLTTFLARQLAVNQMAHDAATVAAQVPEFLAYRQNLLVEYSQNPDLQGADGAARDAVLRRLFRNGNLFREVLLVDNSQAILAAHPPAGDGRTLTDLEAATVARALAESRPLVSPAHFGPGSDHIISFIAPVPGSDGEPAGVLIGRVPEIAFDNLIVGLQGTFEVGRGFLVDNNSTIIAAEDRSIVRRLWTPGSAPRETIPTDPDVPGQAYEGRSPQTNARELVYSQTVATPQAWQVVITLPYEVVLRLALQMGLPLTGVLVFLVIAVAAALTLLGQSITQPVIELVEASESIAGGSLDTPIRATGDDELGQLGRAFETMQRSLKRRLDELALLVNVGQEVTASLNLDEGMPAILQGAIRGTGASGARAVVLNPLERTPLIFSAGPAGDMMSPFDRWVVSETRRKRELILREPQQLRELLPAEPPFRAILAIGLYHHNEFQGAVWLAYRRPHQFDPIELNLVRTLASQASVLAANARLFTSATSGRRRLAAVLASTSDAVIVTDQTNNVLLINPAMERAFGLRAAGVIGHPVRNVIDNEKLLLALTTERRVRNMEIGTGDGRIFSVSASPISSDGQAMGRVAVLHDITQLKEVDEMKSEFVSTVSHDLRGPLSYMRGYATMIPMVGELNEQQQMYLDRILSGIDHMSQLVHDLLDLGRIEAGMKLDLSEFEVVELLRIIAVEHKQPAESAGISFVVSSDPEIPPIEADKGLIRQAITNLVTNAIHYAPGSKQVILRVGFSDGMVVISVEDHGPGISEADQRQLFERFYRVKQRGTPPVKGSGLGLAIVKSIAERHGGRVWCESELGRGSTFYIALPLRPPAAHESDDEPVE